MSANEKIICFSDGCDFFKSNTQPENETKQSDCKTSDEVMSNLKSYLEFPLNVISKNTLQTLIDFEKLRVAKDGLLFNCEIVNLTKLNNRINSELKKEKESKGKSHRKIFIVEDGDGNSKNRDVHYSVVDVLFDVDNTFYCGVFDAAFFSCLDIVDRLEDHKSLKKLFYAEGGTIQNDAWSCPFFSLTQAISLTYTPIDYSKLKTNKKENKIPWVCFFPHVIWNAQSWKFITQYVENYITHPRRARHDLTKKYGFFKRAFDVHISKSIKIEKDGTVRNHGIMLDGKKIVNEFLEFYDKSKKEKKRALFQCNDFGVMLKY